VRKPDPIRRLVPADHALIAANFLGDEHFAYFLASHPKTYWLARKRGIEHEDVVQLCWLGVVIAAAKYDESKASFKTFAALWMRATVQKQIEFLSADMRVPDRHVDHPDAGFQDRGSYGRCESIWNAIPAPEPGPVGDFGAALAIALQKLPPDQRVFMEKRYGMNGHDRTPDRELATEFTSLKIAGKPISRKAVACRASRVLSTLRRLMSEEMVA